ncbi:MAG: hypothetical protein M1833_001619 [Piccolia ochrophora]|nr:MAG: hypothetical protein M1833_001619 [Piccolia ochrophora]
MDYAEALKDYEKRRRKRQRSLEQQIPPSDAFRRYNHSSRRIRKQDHEKVLVDNPWAPPPMGQRNQRPAATRASKRGSSLEAWKARKKARDHLKISRAGIPQRPQVSRGATYNDWDQDAVVNSLELVEDFQKLMKPERQSVKLQEPSLPDKRVQPDLVAEREDPDDPTPAFSAYIQGIYQKYPTVYPSEVWDYYLQGYKLRDVPRSLGPTNYFSVLRQMLGQDCNQRSGPKWRFVKKLGKGGFGEVALWERDTVPGQQGSWRIAVKDMERHHFFKDYNSEAQLTRRLNALGGSLNIVNIIDWANLANGKLRMALEYCEYGDLDSLLKYYERRGLLFPEGFIWHVFNSMAAAVCLCARGTLKAEKNPEWEEIFNGDIKPHNILLAKQAPQFMYPIPKMADLGLAYTIPNESVRSMKRGYRAGTPKYMAPEIDKKRGNPGPHADIYALGKVVLHMLRLLKPQVSEFTKRRITDSRRLDLLFYNQDLHSLAAQCASNDPSARPEPYELYQKTLWGAATYKMHANEWTLREADLQRGGFCWGKFVHPQEFASNDDLLTAYARFQQETLDRWDNCVTRALLREEKEKEKKKIQVTEWMREKEKRDARVAAEYAKAKAIADKAAQPAQPAEPTSPFLVERQWTSPAPVPARRPFPTLERASTALRPQYPGQRRDLHDPAVQRNSPRPHPHDTYLRERPDPIPPTWQHRGGNGDRDTQAIRVQLASLLRQGDTPQPPRGWPDLGPQNRAYTAPREEAAESSRQYAKSRMERLGAMFRRR